MTQGYNVRDVIAEQSYGKAARDRLPPQPKGFRFYQVECIVDEYDEPVGMLVYGGLFRRRIDRTPIGGTSVGIIVTHEEMQEYV